MQSWATKVLARVYRFAAIGLECLGYRENDCWKLHVEISVASCSSSSLCSPPSTILHVGGGWNTLEILLLVCGGFFFPLSRFAIINCQLEGSSHVFKTYLARWVLGVRAGKSRDNSVMSISEAARRLFSLLKSVDKTLKVQRRHLSARNVLPHGTSWMGYSSRILFNRHTINSSWASEKTQ